MEGKVKWFNKKNGYGFITSSSGNDHHFNVQGIIGSDLPDNGDQVKFNSIQNKETKASEP